MCSYSETAQNAKLVSKTVRVHDDVDRDGLRNLPSESRYSLGESHNVHGVVAVQREDTRKERLGSEILRIMLTVGVEWMSGWCAERL